MSGERKTPFLGRKRLVYPEEVLARSVIARKLYLGWKKNLFPRVFFLRSRGTCEGRIVRWSTRVHQATHEQQDCVFRILLYGSQVWRHIMVYLRKLIDTSK